MRYFKFLLPLLCINHAIAQYNTTGTLTKVNEDGLHEIRLPNAIRSFSNVDLSDFRIFDNGVEVPYFISAQDHVLTTNKYIAFEIMSRAVSKDTSSSIVFKNNLKSISEVVLFVANYAGSKTFNLSGSHNLKDWFGVLNQGVLSNLESANTVSVIKTITFPRCAYQYIKITFNDKNSLPINVLKIGRVYNDTTYKKRQIVSPLTQVISELKGDKKTVIETSFKNNFVILKAGLDYCFFITL